MDGTHNSLATISNGSNKPAQAQLTILYNQGSGQYQLEQTLAPDEQMALDFGKLVHDQVPDKNGHTLPPGLTGGTYRLLDLNDNPMGSLYEGKVIVDKTFGHASYTCMICCGPNNPWMLYDPLSVFVSGFEDQGIQAINSCTGRLVDVTGDFPTWWTDNSSIATSSGYQINGVASGATNHNAQSVMMYWGDKEDAPSCPGSQQAPSAGTNVTTPSQHTYPNAPLTGCRVSVPYDGVINQTTGKKHQAQDTVGSNIQVGTPVYAPESGNITSFVTDKPHDTRPVQQCAGQNSPANYIEITGSDGGVTRLYHVTILASLAQMQIPIPVTGGNQIGTIDISGCTSAPHTHIQRKFGGVLVNFTTPCDNSHFDDPGTYYDDSDGTWP